MSNKVAQGIKVRESNSLLKSLVALLLIVGCIWAAQWQFNRGVDRHARNAVITSHTSMQPVALSTVSKNPTEHEWQNVTVSGRFDPTDQILLRNRYFEGVYGFQLLTRFRSVDSGSFWVDCGWVKAGDTATEAPQLPKISTELVTISARLRLDTSLPRGAFFAIPQSGEGLISKANAQSGSADEPFYLDLLDPKPLDGVKFIPAQLPELSDGPHMAYALQWIFFGGLVVYGRILIRRDVLSRKEL